MARTTIQDVAKAAGVSATTVSHALSGRRHVDPETRARIEAVAAELGYRPNRAAQRLRTGRSGAIALVSSMPFAVAAGPLRLGFMMEIAAVAAGAALSHGLALCLVPPLDGPERLDVLDVDGAIVIEPPEGDLLVAGLRRRIPLVAIGRVPDALDLPFVDLGSARAAELLLDHLRAAGARRIALVTGAQRRASYLETEAAYADFAVASGIPPVAIRVDEAEGEDGARRACRALLEAHPEIDGLCAPVDAFAVGALAAARDAGRHVPDDLLVATRYDGLRARLAEPPLTALELHLDVIAEQAVALLLGHMAGETASIVAAPVPQIVTRASSTRRHAVADAANLPTAAARTPR